MTIRRIAAIAAAGLLALCAVLAVNTARYGALQPTAGARLALSIDTAAATGRLAGALRIPTVSSDDASGEAHGQSFAELQTHLRASFPAVFAALTEVPTGTASLVLHWAGSDATLPPVALLAHQDVVPADPAALSKWTHPPFSGAVADGRVWGRGALDDKGSLLAILEAVSVLLAQGHAPARSVYLVFGHDEEIGGADGAAAIAQRFAADGLRFAWVLDEGGLIVDRAMPGLLLPVALIGIAEKGFLTVNLAVDAPGGHSSKPPRHGAIGAMSTAMLRLQENPMPARIDGATAALFEHLAGDWGLPQRVLLANRWLFEPLVVRLLEREATSDALIRTTTALTRFDAGIKSNVLPTSARATANFRLLPGDSIDGVLEHVQGLVDDLAVSVDTGAFASEPSSLSSIDDAAYAVIAQAVVASRLDDDEQLIVSPFLTIGATDSRHFEAIADNVYRFLAVRATVPEVNTIHGIDESIAVSEYERLIRFYVAVLANADGGAPQS
ncbi:MAG: M20/M25/M40 family metallo-hydrolase [Pseudomonadota bacterium]